MTQIPNIKLQRRRVNNWCLELGNCLGQLEIRAIRNLAAVGLIFSLYLVLPTAAHAATFTLEPQTRTAAPNDTFSVDVKINTEGELVTSADALFDYDASLLSVSSITPGSFFPQSFKTTSGSQVYVGGSVQNVTEAKSGSGIVATINFKAIASGTAALAFNCAAGKTSDSNITRKADPGTDILDCASLTDGSYTISGNVTSTQPTPTPKTLPEAGNVEKTLLIGGLGIILTIAAVMVML